MSNNCLDVFERFFELASRSHALFACPLLKLHRELASGSEIFETYYQLEELRLRSTVPKLLDWEKLRPQAEIELMGSNRNIEKLHYACLSLDWGSLTNYGDCIVKLKESMIAHRASCFQGNTAVIFFKHASFDNCLRSTWEDRAKIAAAVFADHLDKVVDESSFAKILVSTKDSSIDDEFIEVHIFGEMTAKTFAEVKFLTDCSTKRDALYRDAIIEKLNLASVAHFS